MPSVTPMTASTGDFRSLESPAAVTDNPGKYIYMDCSPHLNLSPAPFIATMAAPTPVDPLITPHHAAADALSAVDDSLHDDSGLQG